MYEHDHIRIEHIQSRLNFGYILNASAPQLKLAQGSPTLIYIAAFISIVNQQCFYSIFAHVLHVQHIFYAYPLFLLDRMQY